MEPADGLGTSPAGPSEGDLGTSPPEPADGLGTSPAGPSEGDLGTSPPEPADGLGTSPAGPSEGDLGTSFGACRWVRHQSCRPFRGRVRHQSSGACRWVRHQSCRSFRGRLRHQSFGACRWVRHQSCRPFRGRLRHWRARPCRQRSGAGPPSAASGRLLGRPFPGAPGRRRPGQGHHLRRPELDRHGHRGPRDHRARRRCPHLGPAAAGRLNSPGISRGR